MDDVQRKVFIDSLTSPGAIAPAAFGAAVMMMSLPLHSTPGLVAGAAGVLAGVGFMVGRWLLRSEKASEQARRRLLEKEERKHRHDLKQLEASLVLDGDSRTETCLRQLCEHYEHFQEKVKDGALTAPGYAVSSCVEQLFQACIDQLRRSHELWEHAHSFDGAAREEILDERESVVREIVETTAQVNHAVAHFRRIHARRDEADLAELREELDESLRAARLADQRMAAWERQARGRVELE